MKKIFKSLVFATLICSSGFVSAQAPQQFSYQSVIRDNSGVLLTNQSVGIQISILQGGANGSPVFVERHFPTSNTNGLVTLSVGNGTVIAGDFQTIDWAAGPYYSKIEVDPTGGTGYTLSSTNQFLSVPYALYAASSGNGEGPAGNGISSTVDNGNGTYTFNYTDGSSFTTADLTGPQGDTGVQGPQGPQGMTGAAGVNGADGVGISSTVDNGNGTYTFNYTDGSSFTTSDLAGPQGPQGMTGAAGVNGADGVGIASTVANGNGTYTFNYTDWSSFTTSDLTGPQGDTGVQGAQGPQGMTGAAGTNGADGVGISSTVDNGNGTYTFNYTDGSSFTTSDLTGPQGDTGVQGAQGPQGMTGAAGANGTDGVGISSTVDNGNGTFTFNYTDGSSFTTSDLTGPQGMTGAAGTTGADGVGISSTVDNGNGTFTFNYTDGSSFTTSDLTGPQGDTGVQGPAGNGFTNGTQQGEIKYWDGSAWISLAPPSTNNYFLTFCSGTPTWTNGYCPAEIGSLECASAFTSSPVYAMVNTTGVNLTLPYTAGNGGPYSGQTITSTGVTGLTATLNNGSVVNGNGNLTFSISGIPSGTGNASFTVSFGGQTCTFTIGVQTLTVGTSFGGGIVAYMLQSGDPGYSASEIHGLIAANGDLIGTYGWGCNGVTVGGTSPGFGTGMANTIQITSVCGAGTAAQSCDAQTINGYTDWYLPSTNELLAIYPNAGLIGGFSATRYWTSTELGGNAARAIDFTTGAGTITSRTSLYPVRAIRSF